MAQQWAEVPQAVKKETEEYISESDLVGLFLGAGAR